MPSRTLLPPMMSTTVTVMSSPTMKVSPILRVRTSTGRPPWRSGGSGASARLGGQDGHVLGLVLADRPGRRAVFGLEQLVARRVTLRQVDHLPAEPLGVVHDDRGE